MDSFLTIATIIIAVITIVLILLQGKGAGLGSAWGGGGETYQTKRGVEKWLMRATILFIVLFFAISFVNLFV